MSGNINVNATRNGIATDPVASAIFNALAEGEKCLCELKDAIGIPRTWESYDIRMLEDLNAIKSRTANGYKYYSLTPSRVLWYLRRSMSRNEQPAPAPRQPVKYESAIEWVRPTMPRISEFESALRRGF